MCKDLRSFLLAIFLRVVLLGPEEAVNFKRTVDCDIISCASAVPISIIHGTIWKMVTLNRNRKIEQGQVVLLVRRKGGVEIHFFLAEVSTSSHMEAPSNDRYVQWIKIILKEIYWLSAKFILTSITKLVVESSSKKI